MACRDWMCSWPFETNWKKNRRRRRRREGGSEAILYIFPNISILNEPLWLNLSNWINIILKKQDVWNALLEECPPQQAAEKRPILTCVPAHCFTEYTELSPTYCLEERLHTCSKANFIVLKNMPSLPSTAQHTHSGFYDLIYKPVQ